MKLTPIQHTGVPAMLTDIIKKLTAAMGIVPQ
jgi:hypothetical protein